MTAILPLLAAALFAASQPAPTAPEVVEAHGGCYDTALVGRIVQMGDFESLADILPSRDDSIWWGGVGSVLVRKDTQLVGQSAELGWVKIIMSALPLPTAKVLLLTKTRASGSPMVVYWTVLGKRDASEVVRELSDAPVGRCP